MTDNTKIEWTDKTWNPVVGCSIASPGCKNCYAMGQAPRLANNPKTPHYHGTITKSAKGKPVWSGKIGIAKEATLLKPLRWKSSCMIFVNSMGDLFHPDVPSYVIDRVFVVMALTPHHTYQVLTKHPERMYQYLTRQAGDGKQDLRNHLAWNVTGQVMNMWTKDWKKEGIRGRHRSKAINACTKWPLPNVWLGTSVENQEWADRRIPYLLDTPAAVRFLSCEPLLGSIQLDKLDYSQFLLDITKKKRHPFHPHIFYNCLKPTRHFLSGLTLPQIDWVIVGGESGYKARPMHPDWARSLRDQCKAAGTPFFFKQWGRWLPSDQSCLDNDGSRIDAIDQWDWADAAERGALHIWNDNPNEELFSIPLRSSDAGRLLDGVEHNAFPESISQRS